ncbi:MAG: hypothetical protein C0454_02725 [Parvibaculum sp.]|nr:hypothetical protein [Parvibaculum sp.]
MPAYTVETTYRLPAYRHRTYHAATPAEACRLAIEDEDWQGKKLDAECVGETFVSGIWRGTDAAYSAPLAPVPSQFEETVQRKADHFETLFGVLKILAADIRTGRPNQPHWLERAEHAVAKAEAIMAGARDPDDPAALRQGGEDG